MPRRVLLAWSSGKDSAWALNTLAHDPRTRLAGLLTTVNASAQRVAMHGVRMELLRAQARALDLPLWVVPLPWPCSNAVYEQQMAEAIARARRCGITHIAFGDLFLEDVRAYRERQLSGTGVDPVFPLWGMDTAELAWTMVRAGIRAVLTCVDPCQMDPASVGGEFDERFLRSLPAAVDPCGERGEFHTFCYAGPMFARPVPLVRGETVCRDGFWFADFRLADAPAANGKSQRRN